MGLTFEEALASVTSDVADIMGLPSDLGRITVGKKANLVVFDGPPLTLQVRRWWSCVSVPVVGGEGSWARVHLRACCVASPLTRVLGRASTCYHIQGHPALVVLGDYADCHTQQR